MPTNLEDKFCKLKCRKIKTIKICCGTDSVTPWHANIQTYKHTDMPAHQTTPQGIACVSMHVHSIMGACRKCTAILNLADAYVKYVVYSIQTENKNCSYLPTHIFTFFLSFVYYSLFLLLSYCLHIFHIFKSGYGAYAVVCASVFVFPIALLVSWLCWSIANLILLAACSTLQIVENVESEESKPK